MDELNSCGAPTALVLSIFMVSSMAFSSIHISAQR
jgi:hypothetical protein